MKESGAGWLVAGIVCCATGHIFLGIVCILIAIEWD